MNLTGTSMETGLPHCNSREAMLAWLFFDGAPVKSSLVSDFRGEQEKMPPSESRRGGTRRDPRGARLP